MSACESKLSLGVINGRVYQRPGEEGLPTLKECAENAGLLFDAGRFERSGRDLGKLVDEKQKAYGDSFGKAGAVLAILYPNGVKAEQMSDMLAVARIVDKLFRVANRKDAFGENPYRDIAGYALLGSVKP